MHRVRTVVPLVLIALLVLTACSSETNKSDKKRPTTTSTRSKAARTTTSTSAVPSTTPTTLAPPPSPTTPAPAPSPIAAPRVDACGARAGPIYAAVQGGDLGPVPLSQYTITDCRIANSNQIWSAITLAPNPGSGVTQLTVALERVGSIWQVRAYGPNQVSCDAPPPVPQELRLGC